MMKAIETAALRGRVFQEWTLWGRRLVAGSISHNRHGFKAWATFIPIALNDLQRLLVLFQPIAGGLKERQACAQLWLATLAVIGPVDLLRDNSRCRS
jgi:hypothetical protein